MKSPKKKFLLPFPTGKISTIQQYLVWKFCEKPSQINWPKETKIANSLLKLYPELEFWQCAGLDFKIESLCYFLGDRGINQLKFFYLKFKYRLPAAPKPKTLKEKIGEDFVLAVKAKKFFNFKSYH